MKIAITGGIGSGKSTVASYLKEKGFPVFSCDEIYEELLQDDKFLKLLTEPFGREIIKDGKLDRKALAGIVFGDRKALERLNTVAHPPIIREALHRAEGYSLSFCEVPLLFENGYEKLFDDVIVVLRAKEERVKSIRVRSHLTESEALYRINSQYNYESGNFAKYYVIHNDGDFVDLRQKTEQILAEIQNKLS